MDGLWRAKPSLRCYIVAGPRAATAVASCSTSGSDVDVKAGTVMFWQTKNGDVRTIPMTATLRELLQTLPRPLDHTAHVSPQRFPQALSRSFAHLAKALGLKDLSFHSLRHDAASTLTVAGVSQRAVMAMLGHRDPRMSIRYQHLSPEHLQDVARALDTRPHEGSPSGSITAPARGGERKCWWPQREVTVRGAS